MQQSCTYGSVRGAPGNQRPYRDKTGAVGIRPSSYFFFLRLRFILRRGPRRGIRAANACFSKVKTQFSPDLHGLNRREY